MKKTWLAFIIAPLLILTACETDGTTAPASTAPLPHSAKGYELYSWQQAGEWRFTLILGTNRVKFAEEIIPGANTTFEASDTRGITLDNLLSTLERLPRDEWVFWNILKDTGMSYPPQEITGQVTDRAAHLGIQLVVAPLYG